jgi:Holliday junction resolvase RusA-like endonuclease
MNKIKIIIDQDILEKYYKWYFDKYPKRHVLPIESAISKSLNQWMIMNRQKMNHEKQKWKDFGIWLIDFCGFNNLKIKKCKIIIEYFFADRRKRDADNYLPKNLLDAFVEAGLLSDDSFNCVEALTILGNYSKNSARTEINIEYED